MRISSNSSNNAAQNARLTDDQDSQNPQENPTAVSQNTTSANQLNTNQQQTNSQNSNTVNDDADRNPATTADDNRALDQLIDQSSFNNSSYNSTGGPVVIHGNGLKHDLNNDPDQDVTMIGHGTKLKGGSADDTLSIRGNWGLINGMGGNDTMKYDGNHGTIYGHSGEDSLEVNGDGNYVDMGKTDESDSVTVKGGHENDIYTYAGADNVTIEEGATSTSVFAGENATGKDVLIDNGTDSRLYGEGGDDVLIATDKAINSTLNGGTGDDVITIDGKHNVDGGGDDDIVNVTNGLGSTLTGGSGYDVLNLNDVDFVDGMQIRPSDLTQNSSEGGYVLTLNDGSEYIFQDFEEVNFANGFKATLAEGTDKWLISQTGGPIDDNGTEDNKIDRPIEKEEEEPVVKQPGG